MPPRTLYSRRWTLSLKIPWRAWEPVGNLDDSVTIISTVISDLSNMYKCGYVFPGPRIHVQVTTYLRVFVIVSQYQSTHLQYTLPIAVVTSPESKYATAPLVLSPSPCTIRSPYCTRFHRPPSPKRAGPLSPQLIPQTIWTVPSMRCPQPTRLQGTLYEMDQNGQVNWGTGDRGAWQCSADCILCIYCIYSTVELYTHIKLNNCTHISKRCVHLLTSFKVYVHCKVVHCMYSMRHGNWALLGILVKIFLINMILALKRDNCLYSSSC